MKHPLKLPLGAALVSALVVVTGGAALPDDAPREARLVAPSFEAWRPVFEARYGGPPPSPTKRHPYVAVAEGFNAPVFNRTYGRPRVIGRIRRGNALRAARHSGRRTRCHLGGTDGRWYALEGGGFVCDARDWRIVKDPKRAALDRLLDQLQPDLTGALPFRYARVTTKGAPRLSRLPTARELSAIEEALPTRANGPDVVKERMWDDFFLALDREVEHAGRTFWRTVEGEYVLKEHVTLRPTPPLVGERVAGGLPIAFVHGAEGAKLYCEEDDALHPCGAAEQHARLVVERRVEQGGETYLVDAQGRALLREDVRLAEAIAPPGDVPDGAKWVHVDLSEQTLVAYEGERPVYATLVSTGKPGHDTPTGLYRTKRKYLSKTMRGRDPKEGIYHVEEVPFIFYYRGGYAVHGAYWHNTFGNVRSHGCTNVAPADARWLYHWATLEVPERWHALVGQQGTWFYFTKDRA